VQDKQAAAVFNVQSNKYLKPIAVMDIPYRMQQEKLAAGHPQDAFLQLDLMDQQAEVRTKDDDWTGRTSAAERRKLQNRLHQRKFRKIPMTCSLLIAKFAKTYSDLCDS